MLIFVSTDIFIHDPRLARQELKELREERRQEMLGGAGSALGLSHEIDIEAGAGIEGRIPSDCQRPRSES